MTDANQQANEVMAVIAAETTAFWMKDYDGLAACWLQSPAVRRMGWWELGGITVVEGWDEISRRTRENMDNNPTPQPRAAEVRRENVNIRISAEMAWVTFDQYGADTGEPDMDMPGLSYETRVLEKHDGQWKLVYVSYLLAGE